LRVDVHKSFVSKIVFDENINNNNDKGYLRILASSMDASLSIVDINIKGFEINKKGNFLNFNIYKL
jgi:hypothetical protein